MKNSSYKPVIEIIKKISFFQQNDIKEDELNEVYMRLQYATFNAGDIIFTYGNYGHMLYCLRDKANLS